MSASIRRRFRVVSAALLAGLLAAGAVQAADGSLAWDRGRDRIDARIAAWPRCRARSTPATRSRPRSSRGRAREATPVTARFEQLTTPDALRRLLGELNFALLPQVRGPSRLFVYRRSVEAATERVRARPPAPPGSPIPNELVIIRRPGATGDVEALARRLGARVLAGLDGRAWRLAFDSERAARDARAKLAASGDVESVEGNIVLAPPAVLEPTGARPGPAVMLKPDVSPSTDRTIVGLIDTAVQAEGTPVDALLLPGVSVAGEYVPPDEGVAHGTAMAQTILDGVARALSDAGDTSGRVALSILPVDVYGTRETTNTFAIAQGLVEALNRHVNVVNLSLAGDTDSPLLRGLIEEAGRRGVLFFGAAGNQPVTTPTYPAADPGVIAVTAGDGQGGIAPYAARGSWIDAVGPGDNVFSHAGQAWYGFGTSFATSWVSGWAAGQMAHSGDSSRVVRTATLQRWAPTAASSPR